MSQPETGAGLHQFLFASQWMRAAIPEFSSIIHPLAKHLDKAYAQVGKRTCLAAGLSSGVLLIGMENMKVHLSNLHLRLRIRGHWRT